MSDSVDRSLDEIIQAKRTTRGRGGRGRGRGRGRGARGRIGGGFRRSRGTTRGGGVSTFQRPRAIPDKWDHDMFEGDLETGGAAGGGGGRPGISKLLISNLDYGVSNADIKELFSEFGKLIKAEVHYDKSGRSLGTATVIYNRRPDALKAIKQYNGVPLDGRPMTVQFMTAGSVTSDVAGGVENGVGARQRIGTRSWRSRGGAPRGGTRGARGAGGGGGGGAGGGTGRGRGRGRGRGGRNKSPAPTADQLDAELDAWKQTSDAMES